MTTERLSDRPLLIIGYGNPGREDDGLGPAMIGRFRPSNLNLILEDPYQLTVEDAISLSEVSVVIFVDASINLEVPFKFYEINASTEASISSHSIQPEALLQLTKTMYLAAPKAYQLAIRGYEFDRFAEELSPRAEQNLEQAYAYLKQWLEEAGVSERKESCTN